MKQISCYGRTCLIALVSLLLSGCESVHYYYQAIEGQLSILNQRKDITEVIADPKTPKETREKLALVLDIRKYAAEKLSLPVNDSYSQYVDLKRDYVVWNVFAAPQFSVSPKTWCYPIAGCVAYKGFFSESDAKTYAATLAAEGLDVYVGGVAAYSTLGWFEDPVLNTFLFRSEAGLASLLIHELAHQKLYVQNDSAFNESFATSVEIIGLEQWLTAQQQPEHIALMATHRQRREQFVKVVLEHREKLAALYRTDLAPAEKAQGKHKLREQLLDTYQTLKISWEGYSGYDHWFEGPLNNAQLSTVATYNQWVDSFKALFAQSNYHWPTFYERSQELAEQQPAVREQTLEKLSVEAANYRL
ncbi:MAG: aminopeptidase [Pseudomonadales bacterium]|nr:aminopeptidase [Pseudomonadales bacterium]